MADQITISEEERSPNSRFKNLTERYERDGWGDVGDNVFQIHPSLVAMVQREQFAGFDTDDPNAHLISFLDVCATTKPAGVPSDVVRMRMFGFSPIGAARTWYKNLDREKVTTWKEMCRLFLDKYFPASKAQELLEKIQMFEQYEEEPLHEAWTRFKELLNKCPDHGLNTDGIVVSFYKGLTIPTKKDLDFASKEGFLNGSAKEAMVVIERMAETSYEWSTSRKSVKKKSMAVTTDAYDDLMTKLVKLQNENETLKKGKFSVNALEEESNAQLIEEVNYLQGNYQKGNQAYNSNTRSHPNFSYANSNNVLQPPPGFAVQNGVIMKPKKSSLEDIVNTLTTNVNTFMTHTSTKINTLEGMMIAMQKQMKMVENQIGQIANTQAGVHKPGVFPSNTEPNPKGQQNYSTINLRSGKNYTNYGPETKAAEEEHEDDAGTKTESKPQPIGQPIDRVADRYISGDKTDTPIGPPVDRVVDRQVPIPPKTADARIPTPVAPFPRFAKKKYDEKLQ